MGRQTSRARSKHCTNAAVYLFIPHFFLAAGLRVFLVVEVWLTFRALAFTSASHRSAFAFVSRPRALFAARLADMTRRFATLIPGLLLCVFMIRSMPTLGGDDTEDAVAPFDWAICLTAKPHAALHPRESTHSLDPADQSGRNRRVRNR